MATIRDIAKRAGVSVATVSYVINGTKPVAPQTAARVRRAMEELDYYPNAAAQSLRTRTTHVIGAVISDITNPFFATLVRGVEDCARESGYSVLICNTGESLENERLYLELLCRRRVDGLILAPTGKNDELIHRLIKRKMHIVFIDRVLPDISAPAVLSQNEEGAYLATSHLIQHGHWRIGIVLGLPDVSTTRERYRGYLKALRDHGILLHPSLVVHGHSRVAAAREACRALLSRADPPTALFVTNNLMTIGAMQAIRENGLRCPRDISVVGFDDFEWAEAFDPPLTTVAQRPYEIGRRAAQTLLAMIRGRPGAETGVVRLGVELKVRGSVAPPRGGSGERG
jgi:DNA-binding LacI/PurR family transcriptional regulator